MFLFPRKIGELDLKFEIPFWNSNNDFGEFGSYFAVSFIIIFHRVLINLGKLGFDRDLRNLLLILLLQIISFTMIFIIDYNTIDVFC